VGTWAVLGLKVVLTFLLILKIALKKHNDFSQEHEMQRKTQFTEQWIYHANNYCKMDNHFLRYGSVIEKHATNRNLVMQQDMG
jgi:hypothetical protein